MIAVACDYCGAVIREIDRTADAGPPPHFCSLDCRNALREVSEGSGE